VQGERTTPRKQKETEIEVEDQRRKLLMVMRRGTYGGLPGWRTGGDPWACS